VVVWIVVRNIGDDCWIELWKQNWEVEKLETENLSELV
jgi:hypothetical protein